MTTTKLQTQGTSFFRRAVTELSRLRMVFIYVLILMATTLVAQDMLYLTETLEHYSVSQKRRIVNRVQIDSRPGVARLARLQDHAFYLIA